MVNGHKRGAEIVKISEDFSHYCSSNRRTLSPSRTDRTIIRDRPSFVCCNRWFIFCLPYVRRTY